MRSAPYLTKPCALSPGNMPTVFGLPGWSRRAIPATGITPPAPRRKPAGPAIPATIGACWWNSCPPIPPGRCMWGTAGRAHDNATDAYRPILLLNCRHAAGGVVRASTSPSATQGTAPARAHPSEWDRTAVSGVRSCKTGSVARHGRGYWHRRREAAAHCRTGRSP